MFLTPNIIPTFVSITQNLVPAILTLIIIGDGRKPETHVQAIFNRHVRYYFHMATESRLYSLPKMDRFLKLIGLLTCIVGIIYGASWLMQHFPKYVKPTLQGVGVVALVVLAVRLYLGRDWLKKLGKEFVIGSDLIQASENFLNDLPKPKNETTANFIGHLVYRFTRLGLIGLMLALIPITLLYQQNQLLFVQNERFKTQNDLVIQQNELVTQQNQLVTQQNKRLDQQTYLQEAERRSSLVFLFSNIMDAIDKELKDDYNDDNIRNLSPQLIGRIVALSSRLKPYRYLDGDTLTMSPLSPERGQLLVSLYGSELDSLTMKEILVRSDFSYTDLRRGDLKGINLWGADLSYSHLSYANLSGADLAFADISNANMSSADLRRSNFKNGELSGVNLRRAELNGANLNGILLSGVDLRDTYLDDADLRNLRFSVKSETNFETREQSLEYTNLNDANLGGAVVEKDFLLKVQQYRKMFLSAEYILNNYEIDTVAYRQWGSLKPKK